MSLLKEQLLKHFQSLHSQLSVTLLCNVNIILTLVPFTHFPFFSLQVIAELTMHTSHHCWRLKL